MGRPDVAGADVARPDVAGADVAGADVAGADVAAADAAVADPGLDRPLGRLEAPPGGPLRAALRNRAYVAALLANLAVGWVFYGMRSALLPLYINRHLGRSAGWTGLAFLLSALVQALAAAAPSWPCPRRVGRGRRHSRCPRPPESPRRACLVA